MCDIMTPLWHSLSNLARIVMGLLLLGYAFNFGASQATFSLLMPMLQL